MNEATTTILVIEDEEILRESIADYLEDRNFRVLTAENGSVGIEVFARARPDLVLTDLRMPEVDGLDVLRRVGELSPDTPLIVVSGTGRISDAVQALRLGAWDYILKPVEDLSIITLAADKALERARLRRENRAYQEHLEALVRERTAELERANTHLTNINVRLRRVVESTHRLSVCADVAGFGVTLLDEFAQHMAASGGCLFFLEDAGLRRIYTLEPGYVPEFISCPLPEGSILRRVIEEKQPLLIQDITKENVLTSSGWDGYCDGSILAFPLPDDTGRVAGIITLHSKTPSPFSEQDKEIGTILASYSSETLRAVHATETLRASEARFRYLADMLPEAIFETGRDLELTYANRHAFELFGYSAENLPEGLTALELVVPEDRDRTEASIAIQSKGESSGAVEYQALRKDGSSFPILFHTSPIIHEGEIAGFRGIVVDITERKRMEDELKQYRDHLEELVTERTRELKEAQAELMRKERLSVLGQLTATVAHEIRNPLGTVRTSVFAIGAALECNELQHIERARKLAERNIIRCDNIITELLDYTRDRMLHVRATNLDTWLENVLDEQVIPEGIICTKELRAGIEVSIDREQLRRTIINIVSNAIHALQNAKSQGNQLTVSTHVTKDRLEIRVSDTGCGIPADEIEKIFEPLFSTKTFGVGLGMPIVKDIMEKHGGGVEIQSPSTECILSDAEGLRTGEVGKGTTVTLWLRIEREV